jgi:protein-S-isoprenylcysteine O-methyltransferase Ste14
MRMPPWLSSLIHYIAAPGLVVGLIPWLLTDWQMGSPTWSTALRVLGSLMVAVGVTVVTAEFVRFVREGEGSPAPVAPTRRLVTGGLYRHARNPMYIGVITAIVGQSLLLSRPVLLLYAMLTAITVWAFVHWYEEPTLSRTFGAEYAAYRREVPGWIPRPRLRRDQRRSNAR